MELQLVREGDWRPGLSTNGSASVHEDVLNGRDCEIGWEDVWCDDRGTIGGNSGGVEAGVHDEMEARLGMWK